MTYKLSFARCPVHRAFACISLDRLNGGGVRLTPGKCCGRWEEEWSRAMTASDLRDAAEELLAAAETLDSE